MTNPVFMHIREGFGALLMVLRGVLITLDCWLPNLFQSWGIKCEGTCSRQHSYPPTPTLSGKTCDSHSIWVGLSTSSRDILTTMVILEYSHLLFVFMAASYPNNKHLEFLEDWFRSLSNQHKAQNF